MSRIFCNLEQAAGAHAVRAALVFLNLLEGQARGLAKLFLAHAHKVAAQAQAHADMNINGVGRAGSGFGLVCSDLYSGR
jgi:hypothetical protein